MASAQAADFSVLFNTSYNAAAHTNVIAPGTLTANGLVFGEGAGVSLLNVINGGEYTIDTTFRLDVTAYWRKLVDFKARGSDNGLYENDGRISFYTDSLLTDGSSTNFVPGQDIRLTITRSAGNIVTAYLNGAEEFSFDDAAGDAVFNGNDHVANFFFDDLVSNGYERSPGVVRYIQVFNHALSADDVIALGDARIVGDTPTGNVPEPTTVALMLAGAMTVTSLMKRRRA